MKKLLLSILSAILLLCVWQLLAVLINSPLILPSFFQTLKDFFYLLGTKIFYINLLSTFGRVLAGFFISLVLGSVLGFFSGRFELFKDFLALPLAVLRATPVVAVILILVFSLSSSVVPVAASVLMTLPLIITNISEGVKNSLKNTKLNEMTKVFGFTKKQKIIYVLLPQVKPYFKTSVISSFGMTWKVIAAGEVLSLPRYALGSALSQAQVHLETTRVLSYTLALILVSYFFEALLKLACKEKNYKTEAKRPDPLNYMPEIKENERLALIAPSGFGKTTLLDYLSKKNQEVSYAFQENRLIEELTVFQNIVLPLLNKYNQETAAERAEYYIQALYLSEKKEAKIKHLSGGQKQRVALARALAYPSKILLLDESINSQDYELKLKLMDFIKIELEKNPRTLLFVTHDERDGKYLCEKIIRLETEKAKN